MTAKVLKQGRSSGTKADVVLAQAALENLSPWWSKGAHRQDRCETIFSYELDMDVTAAISLTTDGKVQSVAFERATDPRSENHACFADD